jgi:hypothetical protein
LFPSRQIRHCGQSLLGLGLDFLDQRRVWRAAGSRQRRQFLYTSFYLAHMPKRAPIEDARQHPLHLFPATFDGIKRITGQAIRGST